MYCKTIEIGLFHMTKLSNILNKGNFAGKPWMNKFEDDPTAN